MPLTITFKAEAHGAIKFRRTIEFRAELLEEKRLDVEELLVEMQALLKSASDYVTNDLEALNER